MREKSYDRAVDAFTKAIELYPDAYPAYLGRAGARILLGQTEQVIDDFNAAIKIAPNKSIAYQMRAAYYQTHDNYDRAIADNTKALELKPANEVIPNIYRSRAISYYLRDNLADFTTTENLEKALKDFSKTIELDPNDASVDSDIDTTYTRRGYVRVALMMKCIAMGKLVSAAEEYRLSKEDFYSALKLHPDEKDAEKGLEIALPNKATPISVERPSPRLIGPGMPQPI